MSLITIILIILIYVCVVMRVNDTINRQKNIIEISIAKTVEFRCKNFTKYILTRTRYESFITKIN